MEVASTSKEEASSVTLEEFLSVMDDKLHKVNSSPEEVQSGHDQRSSLITQAMSKMHPKCDYSDDKNFACLLTEYLTVISQEASLPLRQLHFNDFIKEVRLYSHRRNQHIKKNSLPPKQLEDLNRKICKLKYEIKLCEKKLDKYETRELTLEELEKESPYTDGHRKLVVKLNKMVKQLHQLQDIISVENNYGFKPFRFKASQREEINEGVTQFMNNMYFQNYVMKKKKEVTKMVLPDFQEIVDLIKSLNVEHKLGLTNLEECAKKVFNDIGLEVKRRGQNKIRDMFSTYEINHRTRISKSQTEVEQTTLEEDEDPELLALLKANDAKKKNIDDYLTSFRDKNFEIAEAELNDEQSHPESSSADSESDSESESEDSLETLPSDTELLSKAKGILFFNLFF
jgi:hypothetical protein